MTVAPLPSLRPEKGARMFAPRFVMAAALGLFAAMGLAFDAKGQSSADEERGIGRLMGVDPSMFDVGTVDAEARPAAKEPEPVLGRPEVERAARTVALFAAISLAPVAVLMATAFVRINVVLLLLRQAIGSPQIPGNQVITALALLLTALVMAPAAESIYREAIRPYADGEVTAEEAWRVGSTPIKAFMLEQIARTGHGHYLEALEVHAGRLEADAEAEAEVPPLRVVAPAFLISELTTALWIGFVIYLPFLVIDLVVSAVLAATGLIMLPPAQVALPLKLAFFVLADGWWLVAEALLRTFTLSGQ